MKNTLRICAQLSILSFMLIFGMSTVAWSRTYYVNGESGNDSNSGTELTAALKTIQAAANRMQSGDTCSVLPGNYYERITVNTSGTSSLPISFKAEGSVITRGFNVLGDYIRIEGFEITDTISGHWRDGSGVYVEGKYCEIIDNYVHDVVHIGIRLLARPADSLWTSHCTVKGNRIVRAGLSGIEVQGRNNLIESNDISHTLMNDYSDADGMRFMGSGHVIRKNHIHDIFVTDPGNAEAHIDCFQTWGPAYDMLFEQNRCINMNDGMQGFMVEEINEPVRDLTIKNNVILAFRPANILECENVSIVNNSIKSDLNYTGASGYGIELHNSPYATVQNNLFYDVGRHIYPYLTHDPESQEGLQVGNNCIYMSDGQPPSGSPWPDDLWQIDPKVKDAAANDFHPNSDSPLIDSGENLSHVLYDIEDTQRPQGAGVDIGAFEYLDAGSPEPPKGLRVIGAQ